MSERDERDRRGQTSLKERPKTKRPRMYKVLLHNDDYTTQEWVVLVLKRFFKKNHAEATRLMLYVHHKGMAVVGTYPYDIADSKVKQVNDSSRAEGYPLLCTMEAD